MTSIKQVMDYLVDHRAAAAEPASFSDVLEQLVWLIDDNGAGIHAVLEEWLVSAEDLFRVKVALGAEEVPAPEWWMCFFASKAAGRNCRADATPSLKTGTGNN